MKRVFHYYILIAAVIYMMAGALAIFMVSGWISDHYFEIMGESTLNLAKVAANGLTLTDEQLESLEGITFDKLLQNANNQELSYLFKTIQLSQDVKYAYVIRRLDSDKVKYRVTNTDSEFYEMPAGTILDWIWLLDVIVNEKEQKEAESDPLYYSDKNRYTHVDMDTAVLYDEMKSGYFINHDEWGDQISGMVPIYTKEGTYVGLLGVDVYSDGFYDYKNKVIFVLFLLLVIPTVTLFIIFLSFHLHYRKEIKKIVYKDDATGLYTRAYYENYVIQQVKKLRRKEDSLTVIMIDIDDFKLYNDFYGHLKGDEVIVQVGTTFQREVQLAGGCPGRYGGEEFVAIIPNLSIEKGDMLCDSIRKKIENLNIIHENRQHYNIVTVSIGIYTDELLEESLEIRTLIDHADKALYMAKRDGKNCFKRAKRC
ncbi:MAG: GGDEF domain-containing protein [Sedimentibacter sp.]|uniref:GGDEF domain-containing protein n=1 Tax=Sedimentibacter sp. TaxID=1960295 RepID=UPI0031588AF7